MKGCFHLISFYFIFLSFRSANAIQLCCSMMAANVIECVWIRLWHTIDIQRKQERKIIIIIRHYLWRIALEAVRWCLFSSISQLRCSSTTMSCLTILVQYIYKAISNSLASKSRLCVCLFVWFLSRTFHKNITWFMSSTNVELLLSLVLCHKFLNKST